MPSSAYSAELSPDPFLRRVVMAAALSSAVLGVVLLLGMRLPAWMLLVAVPAWVARASFEIMRLRRCYARFSRLRLMADGGLQVLEDGVTWRPADLLPGSVLLRRLGWLRVRVGKAATYGELLRGNCRSDGDWRRAQVLWRHVGGKQ